MMCDSKEKTNGRTILEWIFFGAALSWFASFLYDKIRHDPGFLLDFEPYYLQARALSKGVINSYKVIGTKIEMLNVKPILPLTYAVLLKPVVGLSNRIIEMGFFAANLLLLVVTLWFLQKLIPLSRNKQIILWAITLVIYPTVHCLAVGNLGIIMSFLVVSCLLCFQKKQLFLSALLLALAASTKVTPGLLALVFLFHRQYRWFIYFVGSFILIQLGTLVTVGWPGVTYYWSTIHPWILKAKVPFIYNQSLLGYLYRILPTFHIQWKFLNQFTVLAILGYFFMVVGMRPKTQEHRALIYDAALLLILINIASPFGWAHHYTWAILAMACLLERCDRGFFKPVDYVFLTAAVCLLFIPVEKLALNDAKSLDAFLSGPTLLGACFLVVQFVWCQKLFFNGQGGTSS